MIIFGSGNSCPESAVDKRPDQKKEVDRTSLHCYREEDYSAFTLCPVHLDGHLVMSIVLGSRNVKVQCWMT